MHHLPSGTKRERVNWALWKAAQDGRIERQAPGKYAPLDASRVVPLRDKYASPKAGSKTKGT